MAIDVNFLKVSNYVNSVVDLVESLQEDLMNNEGRISLKTQDALTKFIKAAHEAESLFESETNNKRLQ